MPQRQVLQFDLVSFDASKVMVTPQGFLKVPAHLTGVGVYNYLDPNNPRKMIRRLRSETEVFKPASMATLADAPYTKRHPPAMVDPSNIAQFRKGHVSGPVVKVGSKLLGADIIIEDQDAIEDVKNGVKQLSCGYMATIDDTPGTWHDPSTGADIPYDDQQVDIVYNHVAGVPLGRQGPDKTLLLDRKEFYFQDGLEFDIPQEDNMKRKFIIDGVEYEVLIQDDGEFNKLHSAIKKIHDDCTDLQKKVRDHKTQMDDYKEKMATAEKEKKESKDAIDASNAQLDTLKRELETLKKNQLDAADPKTIAKLAIARATKLAVLKQLDSKTDVTKLEDTPDMDLMKSIVIKDAALAGETIDLKDQSPAYVQAAYDAIERREKRTFAQNINIGTFLVDTRQIESKEADAAANPLSPENRKAGRSAAGKKKQNDNMSEEEKKKGEDDAAYRDKQESRHKDYMGAKSKGGMKDKAGKR